MQIPTRRKFLTHVFTVTGLSLLNAYADFFNLRWFRSVTTLSNNEYPLLSNSGVADWKLEIKGLVAQAHTFSVMDFKLMALKALPNRAHPNADDGFAGDESKSIWNVPLLEFLSEVKPLKRARYIVLHCSDSNDSQHCISINMHDAYHPQTMLAYQPDVDALAFNTGAHPRLMLKQPFDNEFIYIKRIEVTDTYPATSSKNSYA